MIGHNEPPEEHEVRAGAVLETCADLNSRFLAISDPIDETKASLISDIKAEATHAIAAAEAERMALQRPWMDRVERIRAAFRGPIDQLEKTKKAAQSALTIYLERERVRIAREAQEAEERAAALRREAAAKAAEATEFRPMGPVDDANKAAIEAQLAAEHAAKQTPQVSSAQGLFKAAGLRTTFRAKVIDKRKLVHAYRDHPDLVEAALKLANADIRSAKGLLRKPIPGVEVEEVRNAV